MLRRKFISFNVYIIKESPNVYNLNFCIRILERNRLRSEREILKLEQEVMQLKAGNRENNWIQKLFLWKKSTKKHKLLTRVCLEKCPKLLIPETMWHHYRSCGHWDDKWILWTTLCPHIWQSKWNGSIPWKNFPKVTK